MYLQLSMWSFEFERVTKIVWLLLSCFSHVQLFAILWTVAHQAPLSRGFSRQEYWSGLPCPSPGNLPNPGNKPVSPVYPALLANSLLLKPLGKPISCLHFSKENKWSATPCPFTFQLSIFFVAAFISCLVFFARVDVCFCFAIILVEFSEDTKVNMWVQFTVFN